MHAVTQPYLLLGPRWGGGMPGTTGQRWAVQESHDLVMTTQHSCWAEKARECPSPWCCLWPVMKPHRIQASFCPAEDHPAITLGL